MSELFDSEHTAPFCRSLYLSKDERLAYSMLFHVGAGMSRSASFWLKGMLEQIAGCAVPGHERSVSERDQGKMAREGMEERQEGARRETCKIDLVPRPSR